MTAATGDPPDQDQSMDDILASIRRIMLDEQARLQDNPGSLAYAAGRAPAANPEPVLILDSSMVVDGAAAHSLKAPAPAAAGTVAMVPPDAADAPPAPPGGEKTGDARTTVVTGSAPADAAPAGAPMPVGPEPDPAANATILGATGVVPVKLDPSHGPALMSAQAIEALMAPAAAAAAAASVEALLKQLSEERLTALQPARSAAPSLEEVVRAELRPFLKAWLDEHLPPMVERLVRGEITRLIGRSGF